MQPNEDLRPVTRSQTHPNRGNPQSNIGRASYNSNKRRKATRIRNYALFESSPSHDSDSEYSQSTGLSSGSNLSSPGENTTPALIPQSGDSDDPLNSLRSQQRELAIQADNDLQESRRIHIQIRTDTYSCMEIKDMLESLNHDIMQLAALMSEKLRFKHIYAESLDRLAELNNAAENVQAILGRHVTEILMRRIPKDMHYVVIQVVIQSVLAKTCQRLMQRWSVSSEEHAFFATSYIKLRKIDSFETMAQWRAATIEIFKYGSQSDGTRDFSHEELMKNLLNVLRTAGWRNSAPKETIERMFGDHVRGLVENTIRIDRAIMEGSLSQDLHLYRPCADDKYDPSMMEDINQDPNTIVSDEKVAVCVNIGLKLGEDEGGAKESEIQASGQKVVLKAQVLLDTTLKLGI
ncbi:hypothetical protein EDD18DRAFT_1436394 [Armillaria luteobubalina]|uniref:Uncharacterized protein n=1 Tax=Armillaria luteobubalina TaxID=153913 RepID=A0AA39PBD8_9AGAR|nr:hypothetical protein EDD18DRAFT_1436394 [Armillaria luteobubalina]